MTIKYNSPAITEMVGDLNQYGSNMKAQIDELNGAAAAFRENLQGEQAVSNFDTAHKNLTTELEDTLQKLDNLATKVENALGRAIEADGKVGDGFAAF
ncbi:WXG100 family type VII secretion target [Nocardia araoensis]|uniref:WXG100 family type VII secretion target n=1 Tax=Nocardia araoensis TaxID=228600 RepID=UPI0002F794E5|nr:type VII secretion protein EsxR [Nocardia araoensis]